MEISLHKPYLISWLAIPILVLTARLFSQHTVDVQLYDTYLIIANRHVALAGSALLLIFGIGYWLLGLGRRTPHRILTMTHLSLTIGVLLIVVLPIFNKNSLVSSDWLFGMIILFLLAQCAYTINIIHTLLRK